MREKLIYLAAATVFGAVLGGGYAVLEHLYSKIDAEEVK
jgi:hypothetical protein